MRANPQNTKFIFGAKISDDDRENLMALFKSNGYIKTKFYQCQLSDHKHGLDMPRYK